MSLFSRIRIKRSNLLIYKKLKKEGREIVVCNIKQAKTAAIICNSDDAENITACEKMKCFLKEHNIAYYILGFNTNEQNPNNMIGDDTHLYIDKNDFSYFYQPKTEDTKAFVNKEFDVLFNLYTNTNLEVRSIVMLSKAKFKLGTNLFDSKIHDLTLEIDENNNNTEYIIEQMQHYINIINA